jgi:4-hydroxybutyrate dehydrogenase/sulfolactaldehyde 3-reductase
MDFDLGILLHVAALSDTNDERTGMTRVGFVGIGHMGLGMCRNLLKGGFSVTGYDTSETAMDRFVAAGGIAARSAGEAARGTNFVITMLPDGAVVEDVIFAPRGIAETMTSSALAIEMSTILPLDSDRIRSRLAERGLSIMDAPVGRTATEAETGKLLIMAGGPKEHVERARPLFECMGDTIVHCGPAGSGARMKLINNYMTTVSNVVTAETLTLARACGIELDVALGVMRGTAAGRGHMNTTYPDKIFKGDLTPGFMVQLARKDLLLALATADGAGVPLQTGRTALTLYDHAMSEGRDEQDWTSMLRVLEGQVSKSHTG